jgi:hypothetical protein
MIVQDDYFDPVTISQKRDVDSKTMTTAAIDEVQGTDNTASTSTMKTVPQ